MNELLSGTCWGERHEEEIKIAPWLTREWKELDRNIRVSEESLIAKGRARGHKERRDRQDSRANHWQGLAVFLMIFFVLALVENCF